MKASIVDLRYHMNDVLKALDRNEAVEILYHGKVKGTIIPARKTQRYKSVKDHPFCGMRSEDTMPVEEYVRQLRRSRYADL